MVADSAQDLLAPIAHGQGQTLLREALLVADHNAYHLGQLVTYGACWAPGRRTPGEVPLGKTASDCEKVPFQRPSEACGGLPELVRCSFHD
jgi:hypothetical protein